MLKQIGIYFLIVVFFTQQLGYCIAYHRYLTHHDCNNEQNCSKEIKNIICCNGACEIKEELKKQSEHQTEKKTVKSIEKQIEFTNDLILNFIYKPNYYVALAKKQIIKSSFIKYQYISILEKPPCCIS